MIESPVLGDGGVDGDLEPLFHLILTDEVVETARPERHLFGIFERGAEQALLTGHRRPSLCKAVLTWTSMGADGSRSDTTALISAVE